VSDWEGGACLGIRYWGIDSGVLGLGGSGLNAFTLVLPWLEALSDRLIAASERESASLHLLFLFLLFDLDFEREESELESESELEEVESLLDDFFRFRFDLDSFRILSPFFNAFALLAAFLSNFFFSSLRIALSTRSDDFSLFLESLGVEGFRAGTWTSGVFDGKFDL